ncbi:MAG: neuraminidase (sialidase) [Armatimonadetes bacterium]|nr:neuraminidase (sialidase) [Armatimonadota bacterium]
MQSRFVFEEAPCPACHASTIAEVGPGRFLCAWFGGTQEGEKDVGIWVAELAGDAWSPPRLVARDPEQPGWNPVLFHTRAGETLLLYKAGPRPSNWSGLLMRSRDGGETWSEPEWLPAGILGPIKNKPVELESGEIVCGSSVESWRLWACWCEITPDAGRTWSKHGPIGVPGRPYGIIQPAVLDLDGGRVRFLCRSHGMRRIVCADSLDGGRSWGDAFLTDLPNPGSGIDAVRLADGRIALIHNHTTTDRTPLNVAVSEDGGDTWGPPLVLEDEPGEYSYPAIIQASNGAVHMTYTWRRERIKHAVLAPGEL